MEDGTSSKKVQFERHDTVEHGGRERDAGRLYDKAVAQPAQNFFGVQIP